ncbi:MAG TPA: hypothetical protein PLL12_14515 [Aestuariivirga sp.]|nr:hypothetical protein [Aestuariivirga sp.]
MASAAGQKPLILPIADADQERADARAEARARLTKGQAHVPGTGFGSLVLYTVVALALLASGYLWFSGNANTIMLFPTVSETVPSPDINAAVPPAPQTAPPPAAAPATNP